MTDYTATPHAHRTRLEKVEKLADFAWVQGLTPEHVLDATVAQWADLARAATGKPASEETRRLTYCRLSLREAWAAGHPDHPDARRTVRTLDAVLSRLATSRSRTRPGAAAPSPA